RLLDLVAAALEATTNGAQARIQLELVLIKAAGPEVDPSTAALLSRIERLEAQVSAAPGAPARATPPLPGPAPAAPNPKTDGAEALATSPVADEVVLSKNPPAATPPEAPTVHPAAPELKTAITAWPAVVEIVRQGNAMLAALLAGARPVA